MRPTLVSRFKVISGSTPEPPFPKMYRARSGAVGCAPELSLAVTVPGDFIAFVHDRYVGWVGGTTLFFGSCSLQDSPKLSFMMGTVVSNTPVPDNLDHMRPDAWKFEQLQCLVTVINLTGETLMFVSRNTSTVTMVQAAPRTR